MKNLIQKIESLLRIFTPGRIATLALTGLLLGTLAMVWLTFGKDVAVLNPQGVVADQQKDLIILTVVLGLLVIVPVFILLFTFAWKFRETNSTEKYEPEQEGNRLIETIWWLIPIVIIVFLAVVTWVTSHQLDPYRQLDSKKPPLKIQVVALQWKWLFLYPEQNVATVNELRIPRDTPINFELTADSPMSGFWIPSLGSQTYAMNGMSSKLSLQAHDTGVYYGTNTNISGENYSKMNFKVHSLTALEFDMWIKKSTKSRDHLDWEVYQKLAEPAPSDPVTYKLYDAKLYNKIMDKYMDHKPVSPREQPNHQRTQEGSLHEGHH